MGNQRTTGKTCGTCQHWDAKAATHPVTGKLDARKTYRCLWPEPAYPTSAFRPGVILGHMPRDGGSDCACWTARQEATAAQEALNRS